MSHTTTGSSACRSGGAFSRTTGTPPSVNLAVVGHQDRNGIRNDAVYLPRAERLEVSHLLARIHVAVSQEYLYARSGRRILDAAGHFRKERVAISLNKQADGSRVAGHQPTSARVRLIAQLFRRPYDPLRACPGGRRSIPASAREAVEMLTPASRATSLMVARDCRKHFQYAASQTVRSNPNFQVYSLADQRFTHVPIRIESHIPRMLSFLKPRKNVCDATIEPCCFRLRFSVNFSPAGRPVRRQGQRTPTSNTEQQGCLAWSRPEFRSRPGRIVRRSRTPARFALVATLLAACSIYPVAAQTTFATITGTVTDPGGAIVPNAKLKSFHVASNYGYETQVIPSATTRSRSRWGSRVHPGATAPGFSSLKRKKSSWRPAMFAASTLRDGGDRPNGRRSHRR